VKTSSLVFLLWFGVAVFWGAVTIAYSAGWRINHTGSLPLGLWRVHAVDRPITRGQIVSFCPPDEPLFQESRQRGYLVVGSCPGGYEPLLKPVAAVAGDIVEIGRNGIVVNGHHLTNSAAATRDRQGRPISAVADGTYRVEEGTLWVVSDYSAMSFDSRYFGAIPLRQVLAIMQP
jgi:conjugative transfer signal peptidase TraF